MEVPHTIQPPCLRNLIVQLTLLDVNQRPTVKRAQSLLGAIYTDLTNRGQLPVYLKRATDTHMPAQHLQQSGSFSANCVRPPLEDVSPGLGVSGPLESTMSVEQHPHPGVPMPTASGGGGSDGLSPTNSAQTVIEAVSTHTSPAIRSVEGLAWWLEGHQREHPLSVDAAVNLKNESICLHTRSSAAMRCPENNRAIAELAMRDIGWLPLRTQMAIRETVIVRVSSGGGRVERANISLERTGLLIFDGSADVVFRNVKFTGANASGSHTSWLSVQSVNTCKLGRVRTVQMCRKRSCSPLFEHGVGGLHLLPNFQLST